MIAAHQNCSGVGRVGRTLPGNEEGQKKVELAVPAGETGRTETPKKSTLVESDCEGQENRLSWVSVIE